jgi:hypothetical protein
MLAAPIVPLQSMANLNTNASGPQKLTLAYAESVNCPSTPVDAGPHPGTTTAAWGPNNEVLIDYGLDAPNLLFMFTLNPGYTGTLTFHSRAGGAFGNHQYVISPSALLRDGAPFTIDWTGSTATVVQPAAIAAVNELFDAAMATFLPSFPAEQDCYAASDCNIVPNDLFFEANGTGADSAIFGFRPLKTYVQMPVGTSTPNQVYAFVTGGPDMQDPSDAGPFTGMDAGGGVLPPSGCARASGDIWGSCAHPVKPLCDKKPTWTPSSCRDYPQSGYVVTCCPPDGG